MNAIVANRIASNIADGCNMWITSNHANKDTNAVSAATKYAMPAAFLTLFSATANVLISGQ